MIIIIAAIIAVLFGLVCGIILARLTSEELPSVMPYLSYSIALLFSGLMVSVFAKYSLGVVVGVAIIAVVIGYYLSRYTPLLLIIGGIGFGSALFGAYSIIACFFAFSILVCSSVLIIRTPHVIKKTFMNGLLFLIGIFLTF